MLNRSDGFTLVEIMIVIMITVILLGIALPSFLGAREKSRARTCQANLRMIATAKEQWAMDNRKVDTDEPRPEEIVSYYIKGTPGMRPICPSGGQYSLGILAHWPSCSIGANLLPDASDDHIYAEVGG